MIDAGNPAFVPPPDTDQRGQPRVSGASIDIGAVEIVPPPVDLSVSIDDGQTTVAAGDQTTYTVIVTNNGPNPAAGAAFTLPAPADTTLAWTSVAAGGATGNSAGSGSIADALTLPVGASVTYTVTASVALTASGTLTARAEIDAPPGFSDTNILDNTALDTDSIIPPPVDLSVTIDDGQTAVMAGDQTTYTIVVSNVGTNPATAAPFTFAAPTDTTLTWTSVAAGGATGNSSASGSIFDSLTLPAGAIVTYTVTANLAITANGSLVAAAEIDPPAGVTDTDPSDNTASDTDTILAPPVDLSVTITDNHTSVVAGHHTVYTVTVTNVGTSPATGAAFTLAAPTDTTLTWTSVTTGGATGNSSASGSIADVLTLPAGATVTYTVTATLAASAGGTLVTTAAIDPAAGVTDTNLADNTASDTDTISPQVALIAVGAGAGSPPVVHLYDATTGALTRTIMAYNASFLGGVRVASGDFNDDGTPDVVTAAGAGGGPHVRIFDGATGSLIREFYAYGATFTGGVFVAVGDVNGDGTPDIVTGAGPGGGPHVKAFSGSDGSTLQSFFAYAATFLNGVNVAAGDVDGDGKADIITGAGPGGGPHVKVFSGADGSTLRSFFAYASSFTGGVNVAAGDVNGDGKADIVTGAGAGGGPEVRVFDGQTTAVVTQFYAYGSSFTGGVRVSTVDGNGDGTFDLVTGVQGGGGPRVRVFRSSDLMSLLDFFAFGATNTSGVFVG